jgi:hypothetical protein
MNIAAIDWLIGIVGCLPFLTIAGYVLWLEHSRQQRAKQFEKKPTP